MINHPIAQTKTVKVALAFSLLSLSACGAISTHQRPIIEDLSIQQPGTLTQESNAHRSTVYEKKVQNKSLNKHNQKARVVISTAKSYLGTRYRYGGMSRSGIDCSGLIYHSYKAVGIQTPRTSRMQAKQGINVARRKLIQGDLVFFATGRSPTRVSHVGIMVDGTSFIHASSSRGVMISKLSNAYWSPRYLFGKRLTL